jgi:leukotriene-A4 hydrolase
MFQMSNDIDTCVEQDKSSLSNPLLTQANSVEWHIFVDFSKRVLKCTALYNIEIIDKFAATSIDLDTRALKIESIKISGKIVHDWVLEGVNKKKLHLGQRLSVPIPLGISNASLEIVYETDPNDCSAAQWLTPMQTSGKQYPFLFTQCQAIHARSIIPCFDTPMVKMTYKACITVPKWATAVMSALPTATFATAVTHAKLSCTENNDDTHTFNFDQPVPIPSYLLALAVGELQSQDLSPRCRIWSEPSIIKAAAEEFHQTEIFLKTAEEITSVPYVWKRYDLLVLPASFPYGGMENPCLTFVTPTLLAGDGSLVCVIAHEIAHSWTGNLVTNRTWGHFWLNEGWTTWLQRRIMNRIENIPHDMDLDAISSMYDLEQDIKLLDESMTSLVLKLGDDDPDESYSSVPYDKGFFLLYKLEMLVGQSTFLELVTAYLKKFAYGTVTSNEFKDFVIGFWKDTNADAYEKMKSFDWDSWLHVYGMPPLPTFDKCLAEESEGLAKQWMHFDQNDGEAPTLDISGWAANRTISFLDALLQEMGDSNLKLDTIEQMKLAYSFDKSKNAEILFRFCMIAVQSDDKAILPIVVRFITSQGRMKYIRPLYRAMFESKISRALAVETFINHKDFYHPIAAKMVAYDMSKKKASIMEKFKNVIATNKNAFVLSLAAVSTCLIVMVRTRKR